MKQLSHHVKFSSATLIGGTAHFKLKRSLQKPLDVLVATPGRLARYFKEKRVFLSKIQYVVIDEADTMYDKTQGFRESLDEILKPIRSRAQQESCSIQYLLAAATLKPPLDTLLLEEFKGIELVTDEYSHQTPLKIREEFIRVSAVNGKHLALRQVLDASRARRTLVFCNTIPSCQSTLHTLAELGYTATSLHGDIPPMVRKTNYESFLSTDNSILVCTDLAARGLDISQVDHVIMFDFPRSAVEYLHRAGYVNR